MERFPGARERPPWKGVRVCGSVRLPKNWLRFRFLRIQQVFVELCSQTRPWPGGAQGLVGTGPSLAPRSTQSTCGRRRWTLLLSSE